MRKTIMGSSSEVVLVIVATKFRLQYIYHQHCGSLNSVVLVAILSHVGISRVYFVGLIYWTTTKCGRPAYLPLS